jgi:DNA-directed RNA polymerase III subunit RPC6
VPLGPEHVLSIVNTLVYDGRLEEVRAPKRAMQARGRYFFASLPITFEHALIVLYSSGNSTKMWKEVNKVSEMNYWTDCPCGICPVMSQCSENGVISPSSCEYMSKWLAADIEDIGGGA